MKKFIFSLTILLLSVSVFAQLDRSKQPAAGPAPKIQIGEYKSFTLDNGLKVFVVENSKLPRISFSLTVDRNPILEGDAAGYTSITGDLMKTKTKNRTKAQIDEQIDFIGANFSTFGSGMYGMCLKKHANTLLDIMSDVLLNTEFTQPELDKLKKQNISGLASSKNDPGVISRNVLNISMYGANHPYGELMTEKSINNITLEKCTNYFTTYFRPNISYLVIVGDIKLEEAKTLVTKYFGAWKKAEVPVNKIASPTAPAGNRVVFVVKEGAVQSYMRIGYPVDFKVSNEDFFKARIMNDILGGGIFSGRLMQNLREKHAYTYGARSSLVGDKNIGYFEASAQVKGQITDSAVMQTLFEMQRLINEKVTQADLDLTKNVASGSFALRLEEPQTIANFALNTAIYGLPKDFYATYLEKISKVTIDDVQAMAKKYMKPQNAVIVIVGPKDQAEKLKAFDADKKIEFVDVYGNPIQETTAKTVPQGVTAEKVINNYINAIGGEAALKNIQNFTMKTTMDMQGKTINMDFYRKSPNKYSMSVGMGAMIFQKQVFDGVKGFQQAQGQTRELTGDDLKNLQEEARINPELEYTAKGYKLNLTGIEAVEGKDAYVMEVISPEGKKETHYYDVESGLRVRQITEEKGPKGPITAITNFADYKSIDGIKFPHTILQSAGGMEMKLNVTLIDLKTQIPDEQFKL